MALEKGAVLFHLAQSVPNHIGDSVLNAEPAGAGGTGQDAIEQLAVEGAGEFALNEEGNFGRADGAGEELQGVGVHCSWSGAE